MNKGFEKDNEMDQGRCDREAKLMAAFLKNQIKEKQRVPQIMNEGLVLSVINHQDEGYAYHRQKYLVTNNPFKNFRSDEKKSVKNKMHKWFGMKSNKHRHNNNPKAKATAEDDEYSLFSASFSKSVL
ncbi:hypothetical protein HN51_024491 [Arachis hypogaea]